MNKFFYIASLAFLLGLATVSSAWAAPDDYIGDTAIFGAGGSGISPNVLLIVDTSGSMRDIIAREAYDPSFTYTDSLTCESSGNKPCIRDYIYQCDESNYLNCAKWKKGHADLNKLSSGCGVVIDELTKNGLFATNRYVIDLNQNTCSQTRDDRTFRYYATGNWINFRRQAQDTSKLDVAKKVVKDLVTANPGIRFGLMRFNFQDGGRFATSGTYTAFVDNLEETWSGTTKKRAKFLEAVDRLTAEGWTPLAETLFEARAYYRGLSSVFNSGTYQSPVLSHCQNNYIILISDGMSTHDDHAALKTICNTGDCDGDGFEPGNDPRKTYPYRGSDYLDDVAWELYNTDMFPQMPGKQNVLTYTVGFGLEGGVESAVLLLDETMAAGTGGRRTEAFLANNPAGLASALTSIIDEIREVHTSFAVPVAPVSPQNRHASGERVYLGLFQPMGDGRWRGNLKKYGFGEGGKILDKNGEVATDGQGRFLEASFSFWSTGADGGETNKGGAGALLLSRDFSNNPRRIFSNLGTKPDLTDSENLFALANGGLTSARLGVGTAAERDRLIRFVHGIDAYDDNANGNATEKRPWILGDILHSSPVVVHYNKFSADQESDPTLNKSLIFVGANDGQLHAFRDSDGEELWSFIPDILLPDLQFLRDGSHTYFVDMTPSLFVFDKNQNGLIEDGDRVLLVFGLKRGGGKDRLLPDQVRGGYYALDVTVPDKPQFLWKITSADSGFGELGEAWSPPVPVRKKMQEGGLVKDLMVAVFGAGYDNNEDRRFGNTQGFPQTTTATDTTVPTLDAGKLTSPANGSQLNPRGRGLYAVKLGEFSGGTFVPATAPSKLWSFTVTNDAGMTFSFPGEVAALDLSHNGYVDRFYAADTGGQLWRVDAQSPDPAQWTVKRIFQANGGAGNEKGRKFLTRPSVTVERNRQPIIFIGSGDREHPLNEAVVDRFYAVKDPADRPSSQTAWDGVALVEAQLVDVTENVLQAETLSDTVKDALGVSTLDEAVNKTLQDLRNKDGWFIKLDLRAGEKILSPVLVFNKVAYFTTFTPEILVNDDPCQTSNLGVARLYAVDYLTGEAVNNYDPTNDGQNVEANLRAKSRDGKVLRRSDRERTLGSGIPSGVTVVVTETGEPQVVIGYDGGIGRENPLPGGREHPLYWLQR